MQQIGAGLTGTGRLGIIGGGQLARMSLAPATALNVDLTVLCRSFDEAAALAWSDVMLGSPDSESAIGAVASRCDVTTFDHELIDTTITARLEAAGRRFAPSTAVLSVAQSKVLQRQRFTELGLSLPPFAVVSPEDDLSLVARFAAEHGESLMVKADRGGYDGRGVWRARTADEAVEICRTLAERSVSAVLEAVMPLDQEVAIQVARSWSGEIAIWPLVETVQVDGMLRELRAPAQAPQALHDQAAAIARELAERLQVVGVLAIEFFVTEAGLLVNEIATRPHNSGHYTIEGAATSQFEQHIRAVLDLPLGETSLTAPHVATVNVVGQAHGRQPECTLAAALRVPGAHVHLYGKASRPGRKLGHVTVLGDDRDEIIEAARRAVALLEGEDVDA
ncbi:MAG: 5-(carboxyamino)imidazole ribonucleotide synthase [Thermomicrobiales bacterium]|nr:5-(carboxyamino)imidazole ribonucleotide synthase [Thermomicrobiales bacterium]